MKVFWFTTARFSFVSEYLNQNKQFNACWLEASFNNFIEVYDNISIYVLNFYDGESITLIEKHNINYILFPNKWKNSSYQYSKLIDQINPDIVHIHGTEYHCHLAFINILGERPFVVSIQGLVSECAKFYFGGLGIYEVIPSIRDILRFDFLLVQYFNMKRRGEGENKLLSLTKNIIGRTNWDKVFTLGGKKRYFLNNETLRDGFYENVWNIKKTQKFSIFVSQAHYPLKGFHQVLKAAKDLIKGFPQLKIFVSGANPFDKPFYLKSGYGLYICKLIKKYGLEDFVQFLGPLSEEEMIKYYLKCHVFVSSSSIENSSNSICEAQILGVPVVASYVGGTNTLIQDGCTGLLYRFEDYQILCSCLNRLFQDDELCMRISQKSREIALRRHDARVNAISLRNIYEEILNENGTNTCINV